jgi:hypothetical protein
LTNLEIASRRLRAGQRTEVWIADVEGGSAELAYSTGSVLLEVPNWTPTAAFSSMETGCSGASSLSRWSS